MTTPNNVNNFSEQPDPEKTANPSENSNGNKPVDPSLEIGKPAQEFCKEISLSEKEIESCDKDEDEDEDEDEEEDEDDEDSGYMQILRENHNKDIPLREIVALRKFLKTHNKKV